MNYIFDFDHTFILQNSSRVLEYEILNFEVGIKKRILRFFFFGSFSKVVNKILAGISILFLDKRDLRLFIFLLLTKRALVANWNTISNNVLKKLKLNLTLLSQHSERNNYIFSKGLVELIKPFLEEKNIKFKEIIGSHFSYEDKDVKILSNRGKFKKLIKMKRFIYFTDDLDEIFYLKKIFKKEQIETRTEQIDKKIYAFSIR